MLNVDRVRDALQSIGVTKPHVRALSDSGWFLDTPPFQPSSSSSSSSGSSGRGGQQQQQQQSQSLFTCKPPQICTAVQSVQLGVDYWEGLLPDRCVVQYPTEKWRCYFGFRVYPTLRGNS
jgi:hypothetical protein